MSSVWSILLGHKIVAVLLFAYQLMDAVVQLTDTRSQLLWNNKTKRKKSVRMSMDIHRTMDGQRKCEFECENMRRKVSFFMGYIVPGNYCIHCWSQSSHIAWHIRTYTYTVDAYKCFCEYRLLFYHFACIRTTYVVVVQLCACVSMCVLLRTQHIHCLRVKCLKNRMTFHIYALFIT